MESLHVVVVTSTTTLAACGQEILLGCLTPALDIEKNIAVPPPPLLSVHPLRPLYDACRFLIRTHARRLPLIDKDPQTDAEVVISVLTQYRVLKFIAMNVSRHIPAVVRAAQLRLPSWG